MRRNKRKLSTIAPLSPNRIRNLHTPLNVENIRSPRVIPKTPLRAAVSNSPKRHRVSFNNHAYQLDKSGVKIDTLSSRKSVVSEHKRFRLSKRSTGGDVESGEKIETSSVRVAVRIRPFTHQELMLAENKRAIRIENDSVVVDCDQRNDVEDINEVRFNFDHVFWSFNQDSQLPFASQEMVYEVLGSPLLDKALEGFNVCLFAYGMTSSGKSYSILGNRNDEGIIPRLSADIFERKEVLMSKSKNNDMNIEISFYEIYNEKIRDLFAASHDKSVHRPELRVREHPEHGPYVEGLSSFAVKSHEDVRSWLSLATKRRATAATSLNDQSSRSHAVFVLTLHRNSGDSFVTSRVNVVDLAGCERSNLADTVGIRQKEGAAINRSLLTLGRIISMLAEYGSDAIALYKRKKIHIPFRDSALTWLLRESLGGSSQTAMLATVSPASSVVDETLNTLRYAAQTRRIVNCARVCEDPRTKVIRELREEIGKLQERAALPLQVEAEVRRLQQALNAKEEEMEAMRRNWKTEVAAAEQRRLQALRQFESCGLASPTKSSISTSSSCSSARTLTISTSCGTASISTASKMCGPESKVHHQACLVKVHADPLLNETLVYPLREGDTLVSSQLSKDGGAVICLSGALISERHSIIKLLNGSLRIEPLDLEVGTYLNGQWLEKEAVLHNNDRLVLGEHYFRIKLPSTPTTDDEDMANCDFERIRTEYLRGRETRGQWLMRKEVVNSEVASLRENVQSRDTHIKSLEEALEIERQTRERCVNRMKTLENDIEELKKRQESVKETKQIHEIGVGSSSFIEDDMDDQDTLTLWINVTEANQICKKIGVKAHFTVRPSVTSSPQVKVILNDRMNTMWTTEVFNEKLEELRNAWELELGTDAVLDLLHRDEEEVSLDEDSPFVPNKSLDLSATSDCVPIMYNSSICLDEKENERELTLVFLSTLQNTFSDCIKNVAATNANSNTVPTALEHLNEMYCIVEHINGLDQLHMFSLLPSLSQLSHHTLAAASLLHSAMQASADLRVALRMLGNTLNVFCTNLRFRVRNLNSFVVEDGLLSRILCVVRTLAADSRNISLNEIAGTLRNPVLCAFSSFSAGNSDLESKPT